MKEKKVSKRVSEVYPVLDDMMDDIDSGLDTSVRHAYLIVGLSEAEHGVSVAVVKCDEGYMKPIKGFDEQLEYGGFITPLLTLLHSQFEDFAASRVDEVQRRMAIGDTVPQELREAFNKMMKALGG